MAAINQTTSCGGTPVKGTGFTFGDAQYGIDATLSGYVIQSVTVSGQRTYDTCYDQKNAVISELDTDEMTTISMSVIGGSTEDPAAFGVKPGEAMAWANKSWKVRSVTYNGAYNDKKQYTIEAVRFVNFPTQS